MQALALCFHAVLIGASQILARQGQRLEVVAAVQLMQVVKRRRSQFDDGNFWKLGTDPLAFELVVVEEYEAVQAQRQVARHRPQIGGLIFPVRAKSGEIFQPQSHVRVLEEGQLSVVEVILGAHGQQDSAALQVQHKSEERRVGKECRSRWSPYQ